MLQQLHRLPQSEESTEAEIRREYRRQLFRRAAALIQEEFNQATWNAFWITTVEHVTVSDAAERTGKSIGSVYAARSRVMRRLKEKLDQLETDDA